MKLKIGFILFFCAFFFAGQAQSKKGKEVKLLKTVKLKKSKVAKFKPGATLIVQVDATGTLKPQKGYHIIQQKGLDGVFIVPTNITEITQAILGATTQDLGGGAELRCHGCDKCQVVVQAEGASGKNYGCGGNCPERGCMATVYVPSQSLSLY